MNRVFPAIPLTTPVEIRPLRPPIRRRSRILSLGSCFSDVLGSHWRDCRLPCCHNPFGILFNPLSILRGLRLLQDPEESVRRLPERLVHDGRLHHSLDFHGSFSGPDRDAALAGMARSIREGAECLGTADYLVLTWGSAKAWYHRQTPDLPVANCHRLPGTEFACRTIGHGEIASAYADFLAELLGRRPGVRLVLTVSPVRHIRQGAVENQRCKARLLLAAEELADRFPGNVYYFPAYEILLDELRDYRFFDQDLCHPSPLAQAIVRRRFIEHCTDPDLQQYLQAAERSLRAAAHRPIHPAPETSQDHPAGDREPRDPPE